MQDPRTEDVTGRRDETVAADPVRPAHRSLIVRVDALLREMRTDPTFRRSLARDAPRVLAERGFDPTDVPEALSVPRGLDILVTHGQLFGLARSRDPVVPPLELRLLIYGLKPLALIHGREEELTGFINWAEARGFTAILSSEEWDRIDDTGKGGFSNLAAERRPAHSGSGAWRSLVVGVDEDCTVLAWLAIALGWDELLGRLLGYPACCVQAFTELWPQAVATHQGDLVPSTLAASPEGPYDWRANILGRYFGLDLIQHFPCSFACQATIAAAARVEARLDEWEPWLADQARATLAAPAIYTERDGIAILTGAEVSVGAVGLEIAYRPESILVTEPGGPLYLALCAEGQVKDTRGEEGATPRIAIGERHFEGSIVWFGATGVPRA